MLEAESARVGIIYASYADCTAEKPNETQINNMNNDDRCYLMLE